MKVLVTGGAGRLAGYLCREFGDCELLLTDQVAPPDDYRRDLAFAEADLLNFADCQRLINDFGPDVVIALAALPHPTDSQGSAPPRQRPDRPPMSFDTTMRVNLMGLYYLLMASAEGGVKSFIQTSSIVTVEKSVGNYPYLPMDERCQADLTNSYKYTKVVGEMMLKWFSNVHDMQCIAIKPAWIFTLEAIQKHAREIKPATEWANYLWHYIDARDVAWAHRLACDALNRLPKFDSFLVHAPDTQAMEDSRELVEKFCPELLDRIPVYLSGRQPFFSTQKAHNAIGFKARYSWTDWI